MDISFFKKGNSLNDYNIYWLNQHQHQVQTDSSILFTLLIIDLHLKYLQKYSYHLMVL